MLFIIRFALVLLLPAITSTASLGASLSPPAAAQQPMPDIGYGNGLLAACADSDLLTKAICAAYINGVADVANQIGLICLPAGVTHGQTLDVVTNGLRQNPAERHNLSAMLALTYLTQAFPCKKAAK